MGGISQNSSKAEVTMGGIIIIRKLVQDALSVSLNKSGSLKIWHALVLTHVLAFVGGWLL
jgi:hypothetical protein